MPKSVVLEIGCSRMRQREKYLTGNEWINKQMLKKYLGYGLPIICHLRNINKITRDTYQLLKNIRMIQISG